MTKKKETYMSIVAEARRIVRLLDEFADKTAKMSNEISRASNRDNEKLKHVNGINIATCSAYVDMKKHVERT